MRLYLMQHGNAVDKAENPDRPLSEQGIRDVEAVGQFLAKAGLGKPAVWHSGKTRAKQTAERVAAHLGVPEAPIEQDGLKPKDPVESVCKVLDGLQDDLLTVGHLPHLSLLAARLLTREEEPALLAFQQGGVVCLERDDEGQWAVSWMIVPALLQG